jgi:hypothetical protein
MPNDQINNEVLALYPGQIDGATPNVISDPAPPPGVPVQGVPLNLFRPVFNRNGVLTGAVKLRIDPPPVESDDDINAISYWLNEKEIQRTPVTPENRNKPFFFDVFHTDLLDNVINRILYKAHRPSGNAGTSTALWVMYSATLPGGNDVPEDDGDEHPYLDLIFPAELGDPPRIGKDEAEAGITLMVFYINAKAYDVIILEIRRERFSFTVKPADVGKPIPLFIDPAMLQLIGSLDACPFSYTVVDQLLNATHKRRWSKISRADINLTQLILGKAILREVIDDDMDDPQIVDLDKILDYLFVVVAPEVGVHRRGDKVEATLRTTQPDGQLELKGTFEESFGVLLPCIMKLEKTKVVSGSTIEVRYELIRDDEVIGDSRVAKAEVIGGTVGDDKPVISTATGSLSGEEISDGGYTAETVVILTGVAAKGQQVEVFDRGVFQGLADIEELTRVWKYTLSDLEKLEHIWVAKVKNGSGANSDAYTVTVVALQPLALLAPAVNPIDVLAYQLGIILRAEFVHALPGHEALLTEIDPPAGSKPFTPVALYPGKYADFLLDSEFLVARRGSSRKFYWTLLIGGKPIGQSVELTLIINSIAENDPRLPMPNIAGNTGQELKVHELLPDAQILSAHIPLQQLNHPLWITCEGIDKDGKQIITEVRSGEPNESTEGIAVLAPFEWLNTLKHQTPMNMGCKINLDGVKDKTKAVSLPARIYVIEAFIELRPMITHVQDSSGAEITNGGATNDTSVTFSGTASINQEIQLYNDETPIGNLVPVNSDGKWNQVISGLTYIEYNITAKALYGGGISSTPPWIFKVTEAYVEENFDGLQIQTIAEPGDKVETPILVIERIFSTWSVTNFAIRQTDILDPGEMSGNVLYLLARYNEGEYFSLNLKSAYKKVTFWFKTISQTRSLTIDFKRGSYLIHSETITPPPSIPVFFEISAPSEFTKITFKSANSDNEFQVDHFRFYT